MKIINWCSYEDKEIICDISAFWIKGFHYQDIKEVTDKKGYYFPLDQWNIFGDLLNSQLDLDIGHRQKEWKNFDIKS